MNPYKLNTFMTFVLLIYPKETTVLVKLSQNSWKHTTTRQVPLEEEKDLKIRARKGGGARIDNKRRLVRDSTRRAVKIPELSNVMRNDLIKRPFAAASSTASSASRTRTFLLLFFFVFLLSLAQYRPALARGLLSRLAPRGRQIYWLFMVYICTSSINAAGPRGRVYDDDGAINLFCRWGTIQKRARVYTYDLQQCASSDRQECSSRTGLACLCSCITRSSCSAKETRRNFGGDMRASTSHVVRNIFEAAHQGCCAERGSADRLRVGTSAWGIFSFLL